MITEIQRVYDENKQAYGARKVWRQMRRENLDVARCTIERLMPRMDLQGVTRGKVIHRRSWKNLEAVELATLDWVDWFNHRRLLGPIGSIPPAEAEAAYYRQQATLQEAA